MTRGLPLLMLLLLGGCVIRSNLGEIDDGSGSGGSTDGAETDGESAEGGQSGNGDGDGDGTSAGTQIPDNDGWSVPEQCTDVASESAYCLTVAYDGFFLIGMDSGSTCNIGPGVGEPGSSGGLHGPSFAWDGMSIITCGTDEGGQTLERYHLLTGERQGSSIPCMMVTNFGDRLLVADGPVFGDGLRAYDDFEDILADTPSEDLGFETRGSRMVTDGVVLYDAWHSTETLWRYTIDGDPLPDLPLEGHDGWVDGMFVMDGILLLLTDGNDDDVPHSEQIRRFDPQTGDFLGRQLIGDLQIPSGLRCRPGL